MVKLGIEGALAGGPAIAATPPDPPVLGRGNYAEGIDQVEDGATTPSSKGPVSVITSPIQGGGSIQIPIGAKGPERTRSGEQLTKEPIEPKGLYRHEANGA